MTLCIVWRQDNFVYFASDSRLTFGNSTADVGIKVLAIPYTIYGVVETDKTQPILEQGTLGMCLAGSTLNALLIKESLSEVMKSLQINTEPLDYSFNSLLDFIFSAYKIISKHMCATDLYKDGRAAVIIGGYSRSDKKIRVFKFETDEQNQPSKTEILTETDNYLLGDGKSKAEAIIKNSKSSHYLSILQTVIDDETAPSVGGAIQYARLTENNFEIFEVINYDQSEESENGISYMRGGLDLRSEEFDKLLPKMHYIDLRPIK